ncbi:MAG: Hsp70 family protein [Planctomycetes bacterium]|nr:Hsp70 family protein [Planctomycetota bacterium]
METIVGIDLGTTNSEISILKNGKPEVLCIENEQIMPSCVGIDKTGKLIVGRKAKNQLISDPESTVLSIKRKMGEDGRVPLGDKEFTPEEISSFILLELKMCAEKYLGEKVKKAVITVPAYFDDRQRNSTKDAGTLAGLEVVRIINEPTAAAVAYDAGHTENRKILVYDLGGGTFDVSLVVVEDGVVEVKASHGDTRLGGDDFDQLLIENIINNFKAKHGVDLDKNLKSTSRLKVAVEMTKRELSDKPFAKIREEFIYQDINLDIEITRSEYEDMIRPLLQKTLNCIHMCLRDAELLPKDIDKIILVGGSTRTPLVHEIIKNDVGIEPHYEINPDLIVSLGAAIQGGTIAGQKTHSILVDITPYTFGTSAVGEHNGEYRHDVFIPIIKRNTPLPVSKADAFTTLIDNQDTVEVNIFQGEEPVSGDNIFIGNFRIRGLSKVPAGNTIVLTLDLDINGILKVTAVESSTGLSKEVSMDTKNIKPHLNLDDAKRNIASLILQDGESDIDNHDTRLIEPNTGNTDKQEILDKAKNLRTRAGNLLDSVNAEDGEELRELQAQSIKAVSEDDMDTLSAINDSIEDMIFYLED